MMSVKGKTRALLAGFASVLALVAPLANAAEPAATQRITITRADGAPREVVLPLNKAVIVDLPVEARDVLLSNPEIADSVVRTAKRVFIIGRRLGQTNAFFFDANGRQIANLELRIEPDVEPLNAMFKRFAPNASVKAEALNGALVLSGSVKSGGEADRIVQLAERFGSSGATRPQLINLLNVEGKEQVLVKVRVVEMSRSLVKQLGVDLNVPNGIAINDNLSFTGNPPGTAFTDNNFSISGQVLGGLEGLFRYNDGENAADVRLQAFERAGLVRVLAEPNLTAISGESARFLAGGEFPIPVRATDGEITVEFKPFGVGLAFTPVVMSGGRISLKLSTEVSELTSEGSVNASGIVIPALQVRRADTTVEMSSGGALMMAGLIQERTRHALEGVPGAKELPVFGSLFRSRDFINNETELVIIVTPYLVDQTKPGKLKTPGDGFRNPSDFAGLVTERLNAVYKGDAQASEKRLQGPAGHIIE